MNKEIKFDVAVVGAGPAGMIAAGRAAELGARVILIEKNDKPGKKLLLTGNGRCNITNAEFNLKKLVENYDKNGKFLFHAFSVFGPKEAINFFEKLGLKAKTEDNRKVFPVSDKSRDVLKCLENYLIKNKANKIYNSDVLEIKVLDGKIKELIFGNGKGIEAKNYIFCTGGKSYPQTGSTGKVFELIAGLGHCVNKLSPALVPIKIREKWVKRLQGVSLDNIGINVFQNNKKVFNRTGECLFTHFGLSGPVILNISKKIGGLLKNGEVKISIDLNPEFDFEALDKVIQECFRKRQNKALGNFLSELLPEKLVFEIMRMSGIYQEKKINIITKDERRNLVRLLKNMEMTVEGTLGFDMAMVTNGGMALSEIDDKTMKSKIIDNLFFAGEIIDVDGQTGGFNLQLCWSTGYLAGESAAKSM